MTFGDHLEELRRALIFSVLALVLGFCVALLFAGWMVDYVQTPLRDALRNYYRGLSQQEIRQHLEGEQKSGDATPKDLDAAAQTMADEGLVADERYVDPHEAIESLAKAFPNVVSRDAVPPRDPGLIVHKSDLVPLRIYHSIDDDPRVRVVGLAVHEPFTVYIKAAVVLGIVISSPFVFYFIWNFVAAGLYTHEKYYVRVFLPISLGLFWAGVLLAFFVVFRFVLDFLFTFYSWMGINPDPRITDWLTFVLILPIGFGIGFQLPLVMLFLERIGIMSVDGYLKHWRIAVLVIFILAMILTPSDPYSMMLMGTPMTVLYFGGILMCKLMPRRARTLDMPSD
jgi:sec-independent protein translocase protein TatC